MRCSLILPALIAALTVPALANPPGTPQAQPVLSHPQPVQFSAPSQPQSRPESPRPSHEATPKAYSPPENHSPSAFDANQQANRCWTTVYEQTGDTVIAHRIMTQGLACNAQLWTFLPNTSVTHLSVPSFFLGPQF